jgi:hypothetical protein
MSATTCLAAPTLADHQAMLVAHLLRVTSPLESTSQMFWRASSTVVPVWWATAAASSSAMHAEAAPSPAKPADMQHSTSLQPHAAEHLPQSQR